MFYTEAMHILFRGAAWILLVLTAITWIIALVHEDINDYTLLYYPAASYACFKLAGLFKI